MSCPAPRRLRAQFLATGSTCLPAMVGVVELLLEGPYQSASYAAV